jgi:hypothetical protein
MGTSEKRPSLVRPPQICPPLIPSCSRFDSVLFTPKMPAISAASILRGPLMLKEIGHMHSHKRFRRMKHRLILSSLAILVAAALPGLAEARGGHSGGGFRHGGWHHGGGAASRFKETGTWLGASSAGTNHRLGIRAWAQLANRQLEGVAHHDRERIAVGARARRSDQCLSVGSSFGRPLSRFGIIRSHRYRRCPPHRRGTD